MYSPSKEHGHNRHLEVLCILLFSFDGLLCAHSEKHETFAADAAEKIRTNACRRRQQANHVSPEEEPVICLTKARKMTKCTIHMSALKSILFRYNTLEADRPALMRVSARDTNCYKPKSAEAAGTKRLWQTRQCDHQNPKQVRLVSIVKWPQV